MGALAPIKPDVDNPRRLTTEERAQFTLSSELNEILIGLLLGDLHILKQRVNPSLTFRLE
jgi:hypothetical protein